MNNEETFYRAMRRQGVTRRSFLKYCSLAATSLGLGAGMAPKIARALENKPRIPVVWIHGPNAPAVPNLLSAPLTHWRRTSSFP